MAEEQNVIWVESGVSAKTREGFVHYHWGELSCQFSPGEARRHALNLLAAAEAAESDAAFVRFMQENLGQSVESTVVVLRDWRAFREGQE